LLIIIFVVLVVFLRHHRQRKQSTAAPQELPSPCPPNSQSYNVQAQRSTTVPTVTVTPLKPTCSGSPLPDRLLASNRGSPYNTVDSDLLMSSWSNGCPAVSSQIIRAATPTLQKNQYWVWWSKDELLLENLENIVPGFSDLKCVD